MRQGRIYVTPTMYDLIWSHASHLCYTTKLIAAIPATPLAPSRSNTRVAVHTYCPFALPAATKAHICPTSLTSNPVYRQGCTSRQPAPNENPWAPLVPAQRSISEPSQSCSPFNTPGHPLPLLLSPPLLQAPRFPGSHLARTDKSSRQLVCMSLLRWALSRPGRPWQISHTWTCPTGTCWPGNGHPHPHRL